MATALTIAGSDSGGGAGIQADLKTFAACGVHGVTAITAVTAQNTVTVTAVHVLPPAFVVTQIEAVVSDLGVDSVKTGMLATAATVEAVAACVDRLSLPSLVVDPVLRSSRGAPLLDADAIDILTRTLLPLARCVTPNRFEAERLAGIAIETESDIREAAKRIVGLGPQTVIITGGHRATTDVVDLCYDGHRFVELAGPRHPASSTHGTGCTHSAALAAGLARGDTLERAARDAKEYVSTAIQHGLPIGAGPGPLGRPEKGRWYTPEK